MLLSKISEKKGASVITMKTSATQFETLVNFMELNGDLSKPTGSAMGRAMANHRWVELKALLNADPFGDERLLNKWKKVWSDLKCNVKRKAARIKQAINGTGGGPALGLALTSLEDRVLEIIGVHAATGLTGVVEAGLPLVAAPEPAPEPACVPDSIPVEASVYNDLDYSINVIEDGVEGVYIINNSAELPNEAEGPTPTQSAHHFSNADNAASASAAARPTAAVHLSDNADNAASASAAARRTAAVHLSDNADNAASASAAARRTAAVHLSDNADNAASASAAARRTAAVHLSDNANNFAVRSDLRRNLRQSGSAARRRLWQSPRQRRDSPHERRSHRTPRRNRLTTTDYFLESDERFREFERERWNKDNEREKERNSIREKELALQERQIAATERELALNERRMETTVLWQQIAGRALNIVENYINHN